jgi:MFS family permease
VKQESRERSIVVVTMLAIFSFSLQQTVVNPTLPALQIEFGTNTAWSTWVITGFIFVGAVTTPLVGRLADQFGRKPLLQATIATFGLASIGAAFAPNIAVLIACRAVSGISGAFLALCLALATQHFRKERVGTAVGAIAAALALGNVVGVTVGPVVADAWSWRWMFGAVAFFAFLALAVSVRGIPGEHTQQRSAVDVKGAALLAVGIGSLMLALTEANSWGWTSLRVAALFVCSAAAVVAWGFVETRVAEPMIDLRVLRRRTVAMTVTATALAGFGVFSWFMLVPRLVAVPRGLSPELAATVHYGFGASSTKAGMFMLPGMLMSLLVASFLGAIAARFGWRLPLFGILCLLAIGYAGLALFHGRAWQIVVFMVLCGVGGPISSVAGKIVADDVPRADHGLVTGLTMVAYYIGGVVGGQVCAAVLTAQTIAGTTTPTEGAYTTCFLLAAGAAAAAIPFAALASSRWRRRPVEVEQDMPVVNQAFG